MLGTLWAVVALALGWVGYAYVGYPLLLAMRRGTRPRLDPDYAPPVSVIITVYNGASELPGALDRMLAQSYDGPLELLVASDGSDDSTDDVARSYADRGVRLIRNEPRGGKESAQATAIAAATGDVLVFCDVGSHLVDGALAALVAPLADPEIGSVSSEDRVDSTEGEGVYVRYEMWLRRRENELTGLIGLSGSLFAARRELCDPWPTDLASDFRTALETARRGYRAVSSPDAQVGIRTAADPSREWERKVRTVRRGIAVLSAYRELLVPGRAAVTPALWGHKVARFTSPFALVVALVASAGLLGSGVLANLLFAGQVGAYAMAGLGLLWPRAAEVLPVRLAAFFVLVNASMLVAWGYHLSGQRSVQWNPTRR